MAFGGGYFKTTYAGDLALVDTRLRRVALAMLIVALLVLPRLVSPFALDLVTQTALAAVGALALNPPARPRGPGLARPCRVHCGRRLHDRGARRKSPAVAVPGAARRGAGGRGARRDRRHPGAQAQGALSGARHARAASRRALRVR